MSNDLVLMNFTINSTETSSLAVIVHRTLEIAKTTNFNISLLQIKAKLYHKLGNFLLPIGASVITKLGQLHFITNWGKYYYKLGQLSLLQIGASVITNQGSYDKLGQLLLQIGAAITNWAIITNWGITT